MLDSREVVHKEIAAEKGRGSGLLSAKQHYEKITVLLIRLRAKG